MLTAGQHSAQQHRRVDRRNFGVPDSFTCIDIREVIKESAMRGQLVKQKRESLDHAQARLGAANKPSLLANAKRSQSKTCRGDARHDARVFHLYIRAVLGQPRFRVRLLPEEKKIRLLKLVEKLTVLRGKRSGRRRGSGARVLLAALLLLRRLSRQQGQRTGSRERPTG